MPQLMEILTDMFILPGLGTYIYGYKVGYNYYKDTILLNNYNNDKNYNYIN